MFNKDYEMCETKSEDVKDLTSIQEALTATW